MVNLTTFGLVASNENHYITLLSPPSFNLLVEKLTAIFDLSANEVTVHVHYVNNKSDHMTIFHPLHLFVLTTTISAAAQPVAAQLIHKEQNQSTNIQPTTTSDIVQQPTDVNLIKADAIEAAVDALKRRLTQQGIEVGEKWCVRVLAKFSGDVDKALAALQHCHEHKQLGLLANNNNNRKCLNPAKLKAHHQQHKAHLAERLTTRFAHQEQKKQLRQASSAGISDEGAVQKKKVDMANVEALVASMADLGLAVGTGRCMGALCHADGDVDMAKANLVAWCAKRQEHNCNKPDSKTTINNADQKVSFINGINQLLGQLDQMGFGLSSTDNKAAERIKRRNARLLKRFNSDVTQVASLLEAHKAKVEARIAACKTCQAERPHCKHMAAQPTKEELVNKAPTAC